MSLDSKILQRLCNNDPTLTFLNLKGSDLGPEKGKILAKALINNTHLTSLNLARNRLGSEGGEALAAVLKNNTTLSSLNLSENRLDAKVGKTLANALTQPNSALTSLKLGINKLGPEVGEKFAEALKKNPRLTLLDLRGNNLGSTGVIALLEALAENRFLASLDLKVNKIDSKCDEALAKALTKALTANTILTKLSLSGNDLGQKSLKTLAEILTHNMTIISLDFVSGQFDLEGEDNLNKQTLTEIMQHLYANQQFVSLMFQAIQQGHLDHVQKLCHGKPFSIHCRDRGQRTPLHLAAQAGQTKLLRWLLSNGAGIDSRDEEGNTALHSAVQKWLNLESTTFNLFNGYFVSSKTKKDLQDSKINIELLLEAGSNPHLRNNKGQVAFADNDIKKLNMRLLVALGQDDMESAEHWFMVTSTEARNNLMHSAAHRGQLKVINFLVKRQVPVAHLDAAGNTPLALAAQAGHLDVVHYLLDKTDYNQANAEGNTPLLLAVQQRDFNMMKLLVERGAKIEHTNKQGQTILGLATADKPIEDYLQARRANASQASNVATLEGLSTIPIDEIKLSKELGEGGFGKVYVAQWNKQQAPVAVKELLLVNQKAIEEFTKEANLLKELRHDHIINFYGSSIEAGIYRIVMEYADRGSLKRYLMGLKTSSSNLPVQQQFNFAQQIALGLDYLHTRIPKSILHLDLKSENVLLQERAVKDERGSYKSEYRLKLADFGLAAFYKQDSQKAYISNNRARGTVSHMAPEVMLDKVHTHKADIYSYGIVLWEMMHCETPYGKLATNIVGEWAVSIQKAVRAGKRPSDYHALEKRPELEELQALMQDCWAQEPEQRPTSTGDILKRLVCIEAALQRLQQQRFEHKQDKPPVEPGPSEVESFNKTAVVQDSDDYFPSAQGLNKS